VSVYDGFVAYFFGVVFYYSPEDLICLDEGEVRGYWGLEKDVEEDLYREDGEFIFSLGDKIHFGVAVCGIYPGECFVLFMLLLMFVLGLSHGVVGEIVVE
jgi:hypothetical protein